MTDPFLFLRLFQSNHKSPAQRNNFSALAGGAGLKTPNPIANVTAPHTLNNRPKSSYSLKRTPPMCHCGKRSKYCTVQSPGPNEGRSFYACSRGRLAKDKCVFFKWENLGESPKLREWISRSKLGRDKSVPAVGLTGKVQVMPKKTPLRDISNTPLADDFIRDNPNEHKACDKVVENKSCSLTPSPQNVPHQYFGNVQLFQPRNLTDLKKQPYLQ